MSKKMQGYAVNRLGTIAAWLGRCTRGRAQIFSDVNDERYRQLDKWGEQCHPDGTGVDVIGDSGYYDGASPKEIRDMVRDRTDTLAAVGRDTWAHILAEEIFEAFAETDPAELREELIQSMAVIAAWIEDMDTRDERP